MTVSGRRCGETAPIAPAIRSFNHDSLFNHTIWIDQAATHGVPLPYLQELNFRLPGGIYPQNNLISHSFLESGAARCPKAGARQKKPGQAGKGQTFAPAFLARTSF
jgi:hypothetical protein